MKIRSIAAYLIDNLVFALLLFVALSCCSKAHAVTVNWQDLSTNETGFVIQRAPAAPSTAFGEVGRVGANVTSYVDATAAKSTTYQYRVAAFNATDVSAWSNIAVVTTRAGITAPGSATATDPTVITLAPNTKTIISAGAIAGYNQSSQKVSVYANDILVALKPNDTVMVGVSK